MVFEIVIMSKGGNVDGLGENDTCSACFMFGLCVFGSLTFFPRKTRSSSLNLQLDWLLSLAKYDIGKALLAVNNTSAKTALH